nr:hypothetical protein [uncultured bacterium]
MLDYILSYRLFAALGKTEAAKYYVQLQIFPQPLDNIQTSSLDKIGPQTMLQIQLCVTL